MATKASREMSDWIKFFTAAGIPPGPAATYAVAFIDNRIQKSMLMDLTRDYLKEMGVSVMGDVISILKHAKSAHSQYERERPLLEAMPQPEDGMIELKRQTTPGNRMLEHYMRKEGMTEENTKVKVTTAMAARLGAVPSTGSKKKLVGVPESVEVIPVKKPRRVPPEEEGAYIISLPKGSTERTKKILNQKAEEGQSSVFSRLGGSTPSIQSVTATGKTGTDTTQKDGSPTVFNRLGSQSKPTSPVLQYQGVLKGSPKSTPTTKVSATVAIPKAKKTIGGVQERLGVQRPEVSTTTLTHMDSFGLKQSLQARLGAQKGTDTPATTPQKITVVVGQGNRGKVTKKVTPPVLTQLSAKKVISPTVKQTVTLKPVVLKHLGSPKASIQTGQKPTAKSGVMARLGQKHSPASMPKQTTTVTIGKIKNRLGPPVKGTQAPKTSLKERLGLQKAEASSTTPTFTVTLGGETSKKLGGGARKRKQKAGVGIAPDQPGMRSVSLGQDVFSRLGSG